MMSIIGVLLLVLLIRPWLGNMSTFVWGIMGNHKLDESEINSGSFPGTWDSTLSCQPHNKCTLFVFWHIHMANDDKRGNDPTPRSSSSPPPHHHHPINKIYISVTFSSVAYLWPHLVHTDLASLLQLMWCALPGRRCWGRPPTDRGEMGAIFIRFLK